MFCSPVGNLPPLLLEDVAAVLGVTRWEARDTLEVASALGLEDVLVVTEVTLASVSLDGSVVVAHWAVKSDSVNPPSRGVVKLLTNKGDNTELTVRITPIPSITLAAGRGIRIMEVVISSPIMALTTRFTCKNRVTTKATSALATSVNTPSQQDVSIGQGVVRRV